MEKHTLYEFCKKIIGNIDPDKDPLNQIPCKDNLEEHIELVNRLLQDIIKLTKYSSSDYYGKQFISKIALEELRRIHSNLDGLLKLKVGE